MTSTERPYRSLLTAHSQHFMKHIFLFPTELEAAAFRALCPDAEVIISGVGMAESAATLARLQSGLEGCVVVLAGIAGAYTEHCHVGEVVEVLEERIVELPERFGKSYKVEPLTNLRGVISNTVCNCGAECCNADIENMEGAVLFAMSEAMSIRLVEIRAISNIVGEEFSKWDIPLATENLAEALKRFFID